MVDSTAWPLPSRMLKPSPCVLSPVDLGGHGTPWFALHHLRWLLVSVRLSLLQMDGQHEDGR